MMLTETAVYDVSYISFKFLTSQTPTFPFIFSRSTSLQIRMSGIALVCDFVVGTGVAFNIALDWTHTNRQREIRMVGCHVVE